MIVDRKNVFYMREFYIACSDLPKVQPLVAQIGWTHNLIILTRCSGPLEREFYIRMTRKFGWPSCRSDPDRSSGGGK